MKDIKAYRPASSSIGQGQVLPCGYDAAKAELAVREMAEMISFDLVEKGLTADQIALSVFAVLITAASSGIPLTVSRLITKYRAKNNKKAQQSVVTAG